MQHIAPMIIVACMLVASCNTTKHVPQGDYLYKGPKFRYDSSKIDKDAKDDIEKVVRPEPNTEIIGMPYKLWLYNIIPNAKAQKGFLHKIKNNITEEPVLLSQVKPPLSIKIVENHLFDHGYFHGRANYTIDTGKKVATVIYNVNAGERYRIRDIIYPSDSSTVSHLMREAAAGSLLAKNSFLNLESLEDERERIDGYLKDRGHYFFAPEDILYRVDTLHKGWADVYYTIKDETPARALEPWKIGNISVYGNYSIARDSQVTAQKGNRTKKFTLIDSRNRYRSIVYDEALVIEEGQTYNRQLHSLSIERLMNLNTFRFTKFVFVPDTSNGQRLLNTRLYVTPMKKRTLRLEASANTKTGNYVGSSLGIKWRNVNLFRGAEILDFRIIGGFDLQMGGNNTQNANAYTLQSDLTITIPRIIPRFKVNSGLNPFLPKTSVTLGVEYLQRPELYTQRVLKLGLDYTWKHKKTIEHTLRPIRIQSYDPSNTTPKFDSILAEDISLRASFEKQIILGSNYQFLYNNTFRADKKLTNVFRFTLGSSGNLYNQLARPKVDTPGAVKIANIPVSQFLKAEVELRGYLKLGDKMQWANRVIGAMAYAFGNSLVAPYAEQFFIGGSSSIRAFRIRTLGPGSYHTDEKVFNANESGDIKFEFNSELRYELGKYIRFAAFMDAGNIWLRREPIDKPGSGFSRGDFFSEMAVGAGLGLRLDFSILLLRFDWAMPLRKPWYAPGDRWVFDEIDLGNKDWRRNNLILNIGIGYPF